MKHIYLKITLIGISLTTFSAFAKEDSIEFSLGSGAALSYGEDITIKRSGSADVDLGVVNFDTNPFEAPIYYDVRLAKWKDNSAWELEFVHHKLYMDSSDLDNDQGVDVSNFDINYNLLYGNYAKEITPNNIARFGAGLVIPSSEITINGVKSNQSYKIAGATFQLGIEHDFPINQHLIFSIEGKMTYSYAKIEVENSSAMVPNTAVHLLFHLKYSLK